MKTIRNILLLVGGLGLYGIPVFLFLGTGLDMPLEYLVYYVLVVAVICIAGKFVDMCIDD